MRNIIFRAKLKHPSLAGQWIYWNVYGELTTDAGKRHSLRIPNKSGFSMHYVVNELRKYIDVSTIGESIGIRDKHKRLIFTGDVVDVDYDIKYAGVPPRRLGKFEVVFDDGCFMKRKITGDPSERGLYHFIQCDVCEVIGNTCDNPELPETE